MRSTPVGEPPLPFKLEVPNPGSTGLGQMSPAPTVVERLSPSWQGTVIPSPEKPAVGAEHEKVSQKVSMQSTPGGEPPPPFKLEVPRPGPAGPRQLGPAPVAIAARHCDFCPREVDVGERSGETATGGHARILGIWPREATEEEAVARGARDQETKAPGAVQKVAKEAAGVATGKSRETDKATAAAKHTQGLRQLSDYFAAEQ